MTEGRGRVWMRRLAKVFLSLLVLLAVLLAGAALWVRSRVSASLPQVSGESAVPGLAAPVRVERDALGVPTIHASDRLDAARALGFLHGQERFFEMDLLRRRAAGEMAELVGRALLKADREMRIHRLRDVARRSLASSSAEERQFLEAYVQGVNAGVSALKGKPFEYLALGSEPAPWRPEDSLLVLLAMFTELQDPDGHIESTLGVLHDGLPAALFDFLVPRGTELDAPLTGPAYAPPAIPGPEVFDTRRSQPRAASLEPWSPAAGEPELVPGSNSFAVAGSHTADGGALLANDMHLGLTVPNIWYRASVSWPDGRGGTWRVTGVTLPGLPNVVVGSNGRVAWGFTNSQIDTSDVVLVDPVPGRPGLYRIPGGFRPFDHSEETIRLKGGGTERLEVVSTIWGPLLHDGPGGRKRALSWVAHHPEAVNLRMAGLETAHDVAEALAVAHRSGAPAQNLVVADAAGHIAWTILGTLPRRVGFDGRLPSSWADGSRSWSGWLSEDEVPEIVDPPSGRLWTANNRIVGGEELARLGEGAFVLGARARQIRDDLMGLERATPRDLLRVQLDDRALFLDRWRGLLLRLLTPEAVAGHPGREEARRLIESWGGHAAVDSAGYRIVREFRAKLPVQAVEPLLAACKERDPELDYRVVQQSEGPLWKLVTEQPPHLLDPRYRSWPESLLATLDAVLEDAGREEIPLAQWTWGKANTAAIRHPLSLALPGVGRWLDMPHEPLPGDVHMPRVQRPSQGASERLVVSPGREAQGIFEMPGGQSGNPLSPHFRDGHAAWVRGEPAPFLPGPPVDTLTLIPARP